MSEENQEQMNEENVNIEPELSPDEKLEKAEKILKFAQQVIGEKQEMRSKYKKMKEQLEAQEQEKLKEQNQFKELADSYRTKYEEQKELNEKHQANLITAKKKNALNNELAKLGLNPERKELIYQIANIDEIKFDSNYNTAIGQDKEALRLKNLFPEAFVEKKTGVDNSTADIEQDNLSLESFRTMSQEDKAKNAHKLWGELFSKS